MNKKWLVVLIFLVSAIVLAQSIQKITVDFLGNLYEFDGVTIDGRKFIALDQVQKLQITYLLNARTNANKKMIQSLSRNIYINIQTIQIDTLTLKNTEIATAVGLACKSGNAVKSITIKGKTYEYGWMKITIPKYRCVISPKGSDDFTVSISGDPGDEQIWYSINGAKVEKR
jgi:hypothetical protein